MWEWPTTRKSWQRILGRKSLIGERSSLSAYLHTQEKTQRGLLRGLLKAIVYLRRCLLSRSVSVRKPRPNSLAGQTPRKKNNRQSWRNTFPPNDKQATGKHLAGRCSYPSTSGGGANKRQTFFSWQHGSVPKCA